MSHESLAPADRRAHVRIPVDLPLTWRREHFDGPDDPRPGRAVDVSEGGLLLKLDEGDVLHLGDVVRLELEGQRPPATVRRRGLVVSTRVGIHIAFNESPGEMSLLAILGLDAAR